MTEKADVIAQFRSEMTDPPLPSASDTSESLWTDDDILRYMSLAQDDFARATFCFSDSKRFRPIITADEPLVKQDPRIIKPKSAYLQSINRALHIVTAIDLDEGYATDDYGLRVVEDWRIAEGVPSYLVTDDETGYFRLAPIPKVADVLILNVFRLPLEPIVDGGDLVIPEEYRLRLLPGMQMHAYRKDDVEIRNNGLANDYEAQWRQNLLDFASNFRVKRRGKRQTKYGGIPHVGYQPYDYGGWYGR